MSEQDTVSIVPGLTGPLSIRKVTLRVVEGPDAPREVPLGQQPVVVGRGQDADLRLSDPSTSRRHLVLRTTPEGWELEDLGSKAGVVVDGMRRSSTPLRPGARIQIGETVLTLVVEELRLGGARSQLLGQSQAFRSCLELVRRVGATDLPVLLRGDSGTGKEKLALEVHNSSLRRAAPYRVVDCTLLEPGHLRSELFGHVRGAFTGAEKEREGAFVQADGGTVFLDEVGELPLDLQPMLLRVLEQGEVQPLGGSTARKVDVRVVSASHRDLRRLVADRTFREDLFFRLSGVTVEVPSLATRGEDILLLAAAFLEPGFELTEAARKRLLEYPWPGNVRELQHVVKRAMALTRSNLVGPEDLFPGGALGDVAQEKPKSAAEEPPETVALREVLERNRWNRKETARELGCDRTTLWRMMKRAGLL